MKQEPLTAIQIKIAILEKGDTVAKLARRWGYAAENLTRVINRTAPHTQRDIRKRLARYLGVPLARVGREAINCKAALKNGRVGKGRS